MTEKLETKENEIVELKDEDMSTITAGAGDQDSGTHNKGCNKNLSTIDTGLVKVLGTPKNVCNKNVPDKHDFLSEF